MSSRAVIPFADSTSLWSCNFLSAIDSELKAGRPGIKELGWPTLLCWVSAVVGLVVTPAGLIGYVNGWPKMLVPPPWWAVLGAGVCVASCLGLLERYSIINLRPRRRSMRALVRARLAAYYRRGQDLYIRLANDSTIMGEDTRQLVADEWVNPVTEYLRGTLGERKAIYFLSIAQRLEPDDETATRIGYQKALARERIIRRLERLREITARL